MGEKVTNIHFEYRDWEGRCFLAEHRACCCGCRHRLQVTAHPSHVKGEKNSIMDSLGFYVCAGLHEEPGGSGRTASVSGEHGLCECFWPATDDDLREQRSAADISQVLNAFMTGTKQEKRG